MERSFEKILSGAGPYVRKCEKEINGLPSVYLPIFFVFSSMLIPNYLVTQDKVRSTASLVQQVNATYGTRMNGNPEYFFVQIIL